MKTYYLESLGCPKNLVDSEIFARIMEEAGLTSSELPEDADLILVNTCAFLRESLAEVDRVLSEMAELKEDSSVQQLWVTGCIMNRAADEFKELFPEVDAWIGLKDFEDFAARLHTKFSGPDKRLEVQGGYSHGYLRISDGCSNHCSYCTIPSIRGEHKSVPIEALVAEARALVKDSTRVVKELVLIAQDTCSYGLDIYGRKALPELLEQLHEIEGVEWIRVLYMHPDHFETDWLPLWQRLPKLLPYFEIPIQHCCDDILKAMGRRKGEAELRQLFADIRAALPNAVFRTTLISGFPGETNAHHDRLKRFIKDIRFMYTGNFAYSREEGTPAEKMAKQVPIFTAETRRAQLMNLQERIFADIIRKKEDTVELVLVETEREEGEFELEPTGRTWFQAPEVDSTVWIENADVVQGQFVKVVIESAIGYELFGSIEEDTDNE